MYSAMCSRGFSYSNSDMADIENVNVFAGTSATNCKLYEDKKTKRSHVSVSTIQIRVMGCLIQILVILFVVIIQTRWIYGIE